MKDKWFFPVNKSEKVLFKSSFNLPSIIRSLIKQTDQNDCLLLVRVTTERHYISKHLIAQAKSGFDL